MAMVVDGVEPRIRSAPPVAVRSMKKKKATAAWTIIILQGSQRQTRGRLSSDSS